MSIPIDVTARAYDTLMTLLKLYLPDTEIWAYGSRVKGTARRGSDLDLVAFTAPEQGSKVFDLREALEESDLPFRVSLLVWDEIPSSYQQEIERCWIALPLLRHSR